MARRTDGGVRFRPAGSRRSRTAPVYSPKGTGCPAIEQAVQGLYRGQNEESFWTLMSALNYALEMETHVLVPLQTALTVHGAPAPWVEHPIPAKKAEGLALWTLRNDKGRTWLPLFTSTAAACADRSTAARPMADRTLEQAMELVLDSGSIDGVVLDPWSNSATLDGALLNGLLNADHTSDEPGDDEIEAGWAVFGKGGNWADAAEHFDKAAMQGNARGLALIGECMYKKLGMRQNRPEARRLWKMAAKDGDVRAMLLLGDDCVAKGDNGEALLWYRRAKQCSDRTPDIAYTPWVCLRMAQYETRYTSRKRALVLAAEAMQGFLLLEPDREGVDAVALRVETEGLIYDLTHEPPKAPAAYDMDSLQLD